MEMERPNKKQNKYNRTFHERWKALITDTNDISIFMPIILEQQNSLGG
jgi:hypothetical protein